MPAPLRLVSYNILEGFREQRKLRPQDHEIDQKRANAARSVVECLAPDLLVLNEALYCREFDGRKFDYADFFGFAFQATALYDGCWGNAILSRYPIIETVEMQIYNRAGLTATVESPMGHLKVATYHPHPQRTAQNKAKDFVKLVEGIAGPFIVCGDLNCISPDDRVDRGKLADSFRQFSSTPERSADLFLDSGTEVFAVLARHGMRDAVPPSGRKYTMPTDLINKDKTSGMRIDHVWVNSDVDVIAGQVHHSAPSNSASDHHPVAIEFRLRP